MRSRLGALLHWGAEHGCGAPDCAPGCTRCERFLEFWNLVFMEYEQHADGALTPLPKQNIDTGLGLERGSAILQDVRSVYETDGYRQIMDWIAAESGVAYGDTPEATKAHRVLADHGRGMTFLVGDGVTPSNEGRGYVLRRIIRRAVQQAQRIGLHDVHRFSGVVIEQMGEAYPELPEHAEGIERTLGLEEERFLETLERGLYEALDLKAFLPGVLVRYRGRFHELTDPWRRPLSAIRSLFSPIGSFADKLRVARFRSRSLRGTIEDRFRDPETTSLEALQDAGFSPSMIERFFRPFLCGIFLDSELRTSSRMLNFVFRMNVPERPVRWQFGIYVCGDHRDNASIQGAMVSGRRAAEAVLKDLA